MSAIARNAKIAKDCRLTNEIRTPDPIDNLGNAGNSGDCRQHNAVFHVRDGILVHQI